MAVILFVAFVVLTAGAVAVTEWRRQVVVASGGGRLAETARYDTGSVLALSRVEVRRLARHPIVWLGIVGVGFVMLIDRPAYPRGILAGLFFPLVVGLFVAVHLAAGRDRSAGMDELSRTLPVGPRTRSAGQLLASAWSAVVLGIASVLTVLAYLGPSRTVADVFPVSSFRRGEMQPECVIGEDGVCEQVTAPVWEATSWSPGVLELAQPFAALLIVAALAVATARWWRHPVAAFLVPVVVFISPFDWVLTFYLHAGPRVHHVTGAPTGVVSTTHLAWHTVYLVGFLVFAVGLALLRGDRRPGVLALSVVGVAAMFVGQALKWL